MRSRVRAFLRLCVVLVSPLLFSLSADVFAQRAPKPDFSALSCDKRWDTLLNYWAAEQRKKKDPCTEARERVEAQRDLMVAAGVCPGFFTVDPADVGRYEAWEQESCSAAATPPKAPATGSSTCPATVRVEQREESVLASIHSFGSAKVALAEARLRKWTSLFRRNYRWYASAIAAERVILKCVRLPLIARRTHLSTNSSPPSTCPQNMI